MGTSSAFHGPGNNPLLPDDFNDDSWKNAKAAFGKYVNGTAGSASSLFGKYVKASGGSSTLAKAAVGGKAGLISLADFMNQVNTNGLHSTLDAFRISVEGKSLDEILAELAGNIAPIGSSKEEAVARDAIMETMVAFYDMVADQDLEIDEVDNITGENFDDLLCEYLKNYITGLLLKDLGYGVEKYINDPEVLVQKEQELRDFVDSKIYVMLKNSQLDQPTDTIVNTVFDAALEIVGGNYE
ncbi:hypothetical protein IGI66_001173 [Enterococcus sp. AZ048]|uniref:hypothetical protein n=1 Tax=Enterococcus sp. AZ048 TaxID=2774658 RepID=UPI003F23029D